MVNGVLMKKLFSLLFLLSILLFTNQIYANVYASGIKISDDTCSTYSNAGSTWNGNFNNGSVKIWFILNESGGSVGSLTATVKIKQGATVIKTLTVTSPQMGVNSVLWNGYNDANAPVSSGNYTFEVNVSDAVGHTNFDSLWVAGSHLTSTTDLEGGTSFAYRGNASITDQTQSNFGNIYVARGSGTTFPNGIYEIRADGVYNQKIGTNPAWPANVPNEVYTVGGKVYGLAGYGFASNGYAKSFVSSTNVYADSVSFGNSSVRGLAIKVVGSDTIFYTGRSGTAGQNAIIRKTGVNGDTSTFINMQQYMTSPTKTGYIKSLVFDDAGNLFVAFGDASASRKVIAKFDTSGNLLWSKSLDTAFALASNAYFQTLAIYSGNNKSSATDDQLYALVYSPTAGQGGIYSVALDGSTITKLISPLGVGTGASSNIINTDPAGNIVWSNGNSSERIIEFSPAAGPNSFTTQNPTGTGITVTKSLGLSGTYYIGNAGTAPGGTNPDFLSLKAACDSINNSTISGNCTFYITSDITEPYTGSVGIGLAVNPDPYFITFKPYTGVQPTITFNYPTDLNSGPSGAFVIGIPGKGNVTWDSLRVTKNIVFDGSNTNGGTTRDLTFQTALTANRNSMPIVIVGSVSNVTIKNCNIFYKAQAVSTLGNLFIGAVQIRSRNYLSTDWVPSNITFDNNHISANFDGVAQSAQAIGFYQSGTPVPATFPNNITIKNNLLEGKRRVIALYCAGSTSIIGNELVLNQNIAANTTNEAIYGVNVLSGSVITIQNNKFSQISSKTSGTGYGNAAINIETNGTYNINNNMIYGFGLTATNPISYLIGIRDTSSTSILNCYFNSIYMNDIGSIGTGSVTYKGLLISNGTCDVKNNIIFSAETNFPNYCFSREGTLGTLTSDYNDLFTSDAVNGNIGYWNNAAVLTFANWQTASSLDANSINVNPGFVSSTDLHLASNTSPVIGKGIAIPSITTDIDGNLRDTPPEMGADEIPGVVPVELTNFTANIVENKVTLSWTTATETNNSHFDIEKKNGNTEWSKIGSVSGNGTTTKSHTYSFVDSKIDFAKATYRIKQVDFDGSYSYSKEVEVSSLAPVKFELNQNYPNPFNPTTTISYSIPVNSNVRLEIFSITGQRVKVLVNQTQSAGVYNLKFDGSSLASGVYIYRLTAGEFVVSKKMQLLK